MGLCFGGIRFHLAPRAAPVLGVQVWDNRSTMHAGTGYDETQCPASRPCQRGGDLWHRGGRMFCGAIGLYDQCASGSWPHTPRSNAADSDHICAMFLLGISMAMDKIA